MNRNSTLLTLSDINTSSIDLVADAYGYEYTYDYLIELLDNIRVEPDDKCVTEILSKI